MPELSPETLQTFGRAVKAARALKGMTLDQAAFKSLGRDNAKRYFSQIENGKRQITPRTAGKIITALGIDEALLEPFLGADEIAEDEVTKADADAEILIAKARADDTGAVTGERLLVDLAYEFAEGQANDLFTAYKSLRGALEAAEDLKAQGNLPQNTSSQLDAVLRRVGELNDEGDRDGAAAFLAAEEERLSAEAEALFNAQLKQDRIRIRPDLAAERLRKDTVRKAHDAGRQRFVAIDDLAEEWMKNGHKSGEMFALLVALELAKTNNDAANGKQKAAALRTLGWCQVRLAERSTNEGHLKVARNAFEAAVKKTNKSTEPLNWAAGQGGLATTLKIIGERNRDADVLRKSMAIFRAALKVDEKHNGPNLKNLWHSLGSALQKLAEFTADAVSAEEAVTCLTNALSLKDKTADPIDWEITQNGLGLALRWLGAIAENLETLDKARDAYRECEAVDLREDAPMQWAVTQWNIADLALARFALDPNPALIDEARANVARARDFFVQGSEYQTERCDELIAQIDAAEAGS